jgi:cytochrome c-type biogenesis protein
MTELGPLALIALPIGLGLLGFVEPCSIGSSLLFIKYLEGKDAAARLAQVVVFSVARAALIGSLGAAAVLVGTAFVGLQKAAWVLLGAGYVSIGALYVAGQAKVLMVSMGPSLGRVSGAGGAAGLGLLFGLNIPACAAPLIVALLGAAAASGASGGTLAAGCASLALFGVTLSLPIVAAVLFARARHALDWLAGLSRRLPRWTGWLLIVLGLWSIGFALLVPVNA